LVYLGNERFTHKTLYYDLTWSTAAFAVSTALCLLIQITTSIALVLSVAFAVVWLKMVLVLATPFFFAGVAISLALTRSPYPVGTVYAVVAVNSCETPRCGFMPQLGAARAAPL
jgi:hypothetical protein